MEIFLLNWDEISSSLNKEKYFYISYNSQYLITIFSMHYFEWDKERFFFLKNWKKTQQTYSLMLDWIRSESDKIGKIGVIVIFKKFDLHSLWAETGVIVNPNDNTTQHILNTVIGLDMKITVHTTPPHPTPPHRPTETQL